MVKGTKRFRYLAILITVLITQTECNKAAGCQIPSKLHGNWFSMGWLEESVYTEVDSNRWILSDSTLTCQQIHKNDDSEFTLLMKSEYTSEPCFYCLKVLYRTINVLQTRRSSCLRMPRGQQQDVASVCNTRSDIPTDLLSTLFRVNPGTVDCKSTFDGLYQFSYEYNYGSGKICDNPDSKIKACQDPGSPYLDNQVFTMTYSRCANISASQNKTVRYQCLGTWNAVVYGINYKFAAIADTITKNSTEKYKCLMTFEDQIKYDNKTRWAMSRFADCRRLLSIYNAPTRLALTKDSLDSPITSPKCTLPAKVRGKWSTRLVNYNAKVQITQKKIIFKPDPLTTEIYYSCKDIQGTKYVMIRNMKGKCQTSLVCFDIKPESDGTISYRVGKPTTVYQYQYQEFERKGFRSICNENAFVISRKFKLTSS